MDLYNASTEGALEDQGEEQVMMTFAEFEERKAACEHVIEVSDRAVRLAENPDFQAVIMKGYFEDEPKRLAMLMVSGKLNPSGFNGSVEDLRAIGGLATYLKQYTSRGKMAREELDMLNAAWDEAVSGDEA